ncbi:hypothetical protein PCIT_a0218 [Pseudoalteromonas citrea]|uniref:DUF998 domain-containing protein n=2 Tax=Pseudoalteromonas citrea TaxID=43655 RepID=A0AAD4AKH6_9GAMM|nr:DUF998 domain-containing protein [Pseudoalteromonas citrea]KAF7773880.1 hypothetical protein PCIT_a0218 [Pseudoalteromonas citrea]
MFEVVAALSGLIAMVWLIMGVYIAGRIYPNYDHAKQFCSELGAAGSPTEKLSPMINNYPLGLLFCLFGGYIISLEWSSYLVNLSGLCIVIHGIGTWVAGYFPMDADPYTTTPTRECEIHSWAGFIMLLALLVAPILISVSPTGEVISVAFRLFSFVSAVLACVFLFMLARGFKQKRSAGLYQRVSYGIQLLWLSVFSVLLL